MVLDYGGAITEGNECGRLKLIFGCGFYLEIRLYSIINIKL
jgi:hypothetical protein